VGSNTSRSKRKIRQAERSLRSMTKYSVEGKALKIKLRKKERADPAAKEREAGIAGRR
jgi:hypothetical protein